MKLSDITALLHLPASPSSHSDAEHLLFLREEGLFPGAALARPPALADAAVP